MHYYINELEMELDAGMNRYVGKPFNLEALVLALQDARPLGPDAASA